MKALLIVIAVIALASCNDSANDPKSIDDERQRQIDSVKIQHGIE